MMTLAVQDEDTVRSLWAIHRGHILLLAAWFVVVAAVLIGSKVRARRQAKTAEPTNRGALSRSIWVWAAAGASVLSAAVHLAVIREHFAESAWYGMFFLVLTVAQVGWAAWLIARPSLPVLAAGAAASLLVAVLWLATRTVGIPFGPAAGEKEAVGSLDVLASAAEVAVAICAVAAAVWGAGLRRSLQRS